MGGTFKLVRKNMRLLALSFKIYLFIIVFISFNAYNSYGFDWNFSEVERFGCHNIVTGFSTTPVDNTNFDWEYYVEKNQLKLLKNEDEAYAHYVNIGKQLQLEYCKCFKILILFHCYNLNLINEFIDKINFFIKNNPLNTYFIKINVPIDDRLFKFKINNYRYNLGGSLVNYLCSKSPYHAVLIKEDNAQVLFNIMSLLEQKLNIKKDNLQIIFSENRGLDIGGFLLLLDQVNKQNLDFDFLVKIHTKTSKNWRKILLSMLNIKINKILRNYDCIYSLKVGSGNGKNDPLVQNLKNKLCIPNLLPGENFSFCGGTMFIAPFKFYDYIRKWDFFSLFNMLYAGHVSGEGHEHGFERLFGYLFTLLNLKTLCPDYYSQDFPPKHTLT